MKIEHFNLESITELGEFAFNFAGNAKGGGEFWGVHIGNRCLFHLRVNGAQDIENIYMRQKNYPYYSPTEKDHFFFFEDRIFHVNPARVDPLAEMIILYFSRMTKKLKPEIRTIQREFGESLNKFDNILKKKLEEKKKSSGAPAGTASGAYSGPITDSMLREQGTLLSSTAGGGIPVSTPQAPAPQVSAPPASMPQPSPPQVSRPQVSPSKPSAPSSPSPPAELSKPPVHVEPGMTAGTSQVQTGTGQSQGPGDAGGGEKDPKELQRERMRERRRRLGLPDDVPI